MTNEILFESMEFIDEKFLEKSEKTPVKWQKWTAIAAGICIVTVAAYLIFLLPDSEPFAENNDFPIDSVYDPNNQTENPDAPLPPDDYVPQVTPIDPDEPQTPVAPDIPIAPGVPVEPHEPDAPTLPEFLFNAIYNDVENVISGSKQMISGYFVEELSEEELKALELIMKEDWMNFTGFAGFDVDGKLLDVRMSTPTRTPDTEITISISKELPVVDYIFTDEAEISEIENVDVKMYRWERSEDKIILEAYSEMDNANVHFTVTATAENEDSVKKDLETVVYLYAYWFNSERLDEIKADNIPEFKDEKMTLSEAYSDEDFGEFMPKNIPQNFVEESVRRYKDYLNNTLSGLWTNGYSQIDWKVSYLREEEKNRITSVETVENYDLSLYPIPMAQSVPSELREIVDAPIFDINELTLDVVYARSRYTEEAGDVSGYRTNFSVLCGDILVSIRTKGVDPEWIFEELTLIK